MSPLLILAVLKRVGGSLFTFLGKLNIWQLGCIALALFAGVQTIRVHAEQRRAGKFEQQSIKANAELKRISTAKNEQKHETAERIKVVTRTIKEADGRARVVETAPLKSECKTPDAVLQADL